jgi:hypothetical protein
MTAKTVEQVFQAFFITVAGIVSLAAASLALSRVI